MVWCAVLRSARHRIDGRGFGEAIVHRLVAPGSHHAKGRTSISDILDITGIAKITVVRSTFDSCRGDAINRQATFAPTRLEHASTNSHTDP
jgi:hypothetical protein